MILECIATSLDDALTIEANGGDRIELISCLECGGYTPSDGLVRAVLASVSIPVAVMLRPNQSSFVYDENQLSEMCEDAMRFQELGVRRVVTGILDDQGIADIETLAKILEGTNFDITFHRAIDECSDVAASLERINQYLRITHILTSLGRGNVSDNLDRLAWYAERSRPKLILGSGVTHKNIGRIVQAAGPYEADIHVGTALRFGKASNPVHGPSLSSLADIADRFGTRAVSDESETRFNQRSSIEFGMRDATVKSEVPFNQQSSLELGLRGTSVDPETRHANRSTLEDAKTKFKNAGFGLFIHFGLYSMLGGEYKGEVTPFLAEWIRLTLDIPDDDYRALAKSFDPTDFDADRLCELARSWGMKYICLTAKHHDGFALFDSKADSFNSVHQSPCARDFVQKMSEACAKHGLLFCLYYSQAQDWDHSGGLRAYRQSPPPELFTQYLQEKCLPQLRELLTNYGPLAMIWLDTPISMPADECSQVKELIRSLQPTCLISGRIGCGLGDYITTGDNMLPRSAQTKLWELPATLNHSWGFKKSDNNWRSPQDVIRQLTQVVSRGGNLLLNIGPDGFGSVPEPSLEILDEVGAFLRLYGDSIYDATVCPDYPYEQDDFFLTGKQNRVFIHLRQYPANGRLWLYHVENEPTVAREMASKSELDILATKDLEGHSCWRVELNRAEEMITTALDRWGSAVIEIEIKEKQLMLSDF